MARIAPSTLSRYLLSGRLPPEGCLLRASRLRTTLYPQSLPKSAHQYATPWISSCRHQTTAAISASSNNAPHVPLRKQMKDEAKLLKASGKKKNKRSTSNQVVPGWELTVGIEIHAQLNTPRKLFSQAPTSFNDSPNTHVAYFDLATPGSQPIFQKETLLPALRAALALNCDIQPISRFDRKHYFHWDQPSGYQITQYYEPFAKDGHILLKPRDGIAAEDQDGLRVGIKQVQMEQDTAKTLAQPDKVHWIDFNRVGAPLIEIITHPDIHYPATAAAFVRKVQTILGATDACTSGMEAGGLRADVNVSVRRTGDPAAPLGQRTEIKNLSSTKAVEDAIIAERDRQIAVLESGGKIAGETRGWSIGATETRRLRGKEGEVDYRYMPDPDLAPVFIGEDLVAHLKENMGQLPDAEVDELIDTFGLTPKDALSLVAIDGGMRVEYFWNVVDALKRRFQASDPARDMIKDTACFQLAANWILHELGRLTAAEGASLEDQQLGFTEDGQCERIPISHLSDIIFFLHNEHITAKIAKELLWVVFRGGIPGEYPSIESLIEQEDLWFNELSDAEYEALADEVVKGQEHIVKQFDDYKKYPDGKLMFLVGQMIRAGAEERINPQNAAAVLRRLMEEKYVPALKMGKGEAE